MFLRKHKDVNVPFAFREVTARFFLVSPIPVFTSDVCRLPFEWGATDARAMRTKEGEAEAMTVEGCVRRCFGLGAGAIRVPGENVNITTGYSMFEICLFWQE